MTVTRYSQTRQRTMHGSPPACTVGRLPDGTPYYVPIGRLPADGDRVCCHLCGQWFLSVASHLRAHGWTKDGYIAAFGLERGNALTGEATHKRRAAAFTSRQLSEPVIRQAQRSARERARTGELTAAAAAAAKGRTHPPQRRPKTLATLAAISPEARAAGTARWAHERLNTMAATVAATFGFPDFTAYVVDRLSAGMSMAAISREAGLHKDWLNRHLARVAPEAADLREEIRSNRRDLRWRPLLDRLGFGDLGTYLRTRHIEQHHTVAAIAAEADVSRGSVVSGMRRHGISRTAHAGKRHAAAERDRRTAHRLGFASLADYIADRRAAGMTWADMAAEAGLPETTLGRRR